ncbi:MAG TPA: acyl-CoA synthetase [Acidimicrobiia bacterium]
MDWNFATAFESVADAVGERTALIQGDLRRTWSELDDRAARLAAALDAAGLRPDAKVASYCYNSNEYVEGLLGTFKMRGVPVNVNYRYLEDELVYLLDNSDSEALLFHSSLGERVANVLDRVPNLKLLLEVDDLDQPGATGKVDDARCVPYEDALATHAPMPRIERSGDDLLLLYTGGTTGMPKGVMWRAEDLYGVLGDAYYPLFGETVPDTSSGAGAAARRMVDSGRAPVHLPASPLMHGTGMFTSYQAMMGGGAIVTLTGRTFDPHELWRAVEMDRVTQMAIVGDAFAKPMLQALRDGAPDGHAYDVTSLALIISSGVMWSADIKRELAERVQCFCLDSLGSSEAVGMAASMSGPGSEQTTAKFTVGGNSKVFTEDGREVEPGSGEVGMVAVGGHIPAGYYKDESKSASTFRVVAGRRWSIPGDFATVEADGSITLLGRGSNCINSGGEKVYPEEVEEAVKLHPMVVDCLVVGVPDERFGEAIAAVITVDAGTTVEPSEISAALGALSRYKHPRRWVFIEEILRAPNGKADYKAARARALAS